MVRTPLNGVLGYAELLLSTDLDHERRELASRAHRAGRALVSTVNSVLDLAQLEAEAVPTAAEPLPVRTIVRDIVDLATRSTLADGVDVLITFDPAVPQVVTTDPGLVRQVLINLVGNAAKFTEKGFVKLNVGVDDTHHVLVFRVRDTGTGIAAADLERIFEPFARATATTGRSPVGSGLGLSISRLLVRRLHGELTVDSTPGVGSVFTFRLPFQPSDPEPAPATDDCTTERAAAAAAARTVGTPQPIRAVVWTQPHPRVTLRRCAH